MTAPANTQFASGYDTQRLLDALTDAEVIALDANGTITSWNAGAENLNGYRA